MASFALVHDFFLKLAKVLIYKTGTQLPFCTKLGIWINRKSPKILSEIRLLYLFIKLQKLLLNFLSFFGGGCFLNLQLFAFISKLY